MHRKTALRRIKDACVMDEDEYENPIIIMCIYNLLYVKHNRTAYNQYRTIQYIEIRHYIEITTASTLLYNNFRVHFIYHVKCVIMIHILSINIY